MSYFLESLLFFCFISAYFTKFSCTHYECFTIDISLKKPYNIPMSRTTEGFKRAARESIGLDLKAALPQPDEEGSFWAFSRQAFIITGISTMTAVFAPSVAQALKNRLTEGNTAEARTGLIAAGAVDIALFPLRMVSYAVTVPVGVLGLAWFNMMERSAGNTVAALYRRRRALHARNTKI